MTEAAMLDISELTRSFRKPLSLEQTRVVGPMDLHVASGERVALTGPNGSGKSTLLRCVAGTVSPSSGSITVGGHRAGSREARSLVGVSFSAERSFYLRLSGMQNLMAFARLRGAGGRARAMVDAIVSEMEIGQIAVRRVDRCSSGMIQQLAVARALLGDPALVLLDEPTRSLDDNAIARMWRTLDARPGATVLIATHRPEDVARCGRNVAFSAV
jgi:ABC-type multidrug transport system ATPase subunit